MKKNIHLICNAHLDPVWLWQWQEGTAEAISTFRTAAEICENNDTFIFNHNEAILYDWIRQYEPELFRRIQNLVHKGRWHIMGGWYLQPDCNLPSGESFVRQILFGRLFFKKWFNSEPRTAINFDPFGHSRGLVQIMIKSGYDSYLFGRPRSWELTLPDDEFIWIGFDGSRILASRFRGWYLSPLGKARETIKERIDEYKDKDFGIVLWGVGNHGGGPSKKDVKEVNKLIKENNEIQIFHSTPEAYFYQLDKIRDRLPVWDKSLNPWATGCYTSQIRIKQKHRLLENEYFSAEKMVTVAFANNLLPYPREELAHALQDLLFGQFHDILPGSSVQSVEEDALRLFDHGLEICSRLKARAFFALASGQPKAAVNTLPVLVYNPHPYRLKMILECEFHLPDFEEQFFTQVHMSSPNINILCQVEQEESNLFIDWRKKIAFYAELEPQQMNRFDCTFEKLPSKPHIIKDEEKNYITFKTKTLDIAINKQTGFLDRYIVNGQSIVADNMFQPIIINDIVDSWARFEISFQDIAGIFELMNSSETADFADAAQNSLSPVRVIEDGPVRTVVEVLFKYNTSTIVTHYKLPKTGSEIELELRIYWNEKTKMLKLNIPTIVGNYNYVGQVAYGVEELPKNGDEVVSQKWCGVLDKKKDIAFTCINDGIYGSDFSEKGLRLTLLRSPAYAAEEIEKMVQERFRPRIDQGERIFHFWFNMGSLEERLNNIDREALAKNEKPYILPFYPPGSDGMPRALLQIENRSIQMTTCKLAEESNDIIIRLFNPGNNSQECRIFFPMWQKHTTLHFEKYEIKSLKIDKEGHIQNTSLMEKKET